jgi:hypothetical protein
MVSNMTPHPPPPNPSQSHIVCILAINAPMIYTAPCVGAFDAGSLHCEGKWEGDWALEIETFLGPVKRHRADRRVPFGARIKSITHRAV